MEEKNAFNWDWKLKALPVRASEEKSIWWPCLMSSGRQENPSPSMKHAYSRSLSINTGLWDFQIYWLLTANLFPESLYTKKHFWLQIKQSNQPRNKMFPHWVALILVKSKENFEFVYLSRIRFCRQFLKAYLKHWIDLKTLDNTFYDYYG